MNETFFLVPQREFEKTFNSKLEPVLINRSKETDNNQTDEKSMEDPVPKNRSECLIW